MSHGIVRDWDGMERLWEHMYSSLNAKHEEHPVLLTEPPLNPYSNRDQLAQIWFETLRAPALYFTPSSVLSLYASGRTTGIVLDVGEGLTHALPIYEGLALPHAVVRSDVAGYEVTKALQKCLRQNGYPFGTTAEVEFVKQLKEEVCVLGTSDGGGTKAVMDYRLPDGRMMSLTAQERTMPPNVLFDPTLIGSEEPGVADVLVNAIARSDMELRSKFYGQIVLAGGSTLIQGFGDRLLHELKQRTPSTKIRISAPPERLHSAYVGGSILASLSSFKGMWVSRAEYEEYGVNALHRRDV